jgi:hypothetical protein
MNEKKRFEKRIFSLTRLKYKEYFLRNKVNFGFNELKNSVLLICFDKSSSIFRVK